MGLRDWTTCWSRLGVKRGIRLAALSIQLWNMGIFRLTTTDERSLARTAPSGGAVLGRLAAGVVVIWAEEATRGCTTCCCSAEFAAAVGGPAFLCFPIYFIYSNTWLEALLFFLLSLVVLP
jgi:hypothetical protein